MTSHRFVQHTKFELKSDRQLIIMKTLTFINTCYTFFDSSSLPTVGNGNKIFDKARGKSLCNHLLK